MRADRAAAALAGLACAACVSAQPALEAAPKEAPKAEAAAAGSGPLEAFGWLAELAGSCWKGDHPDGKTSDTQCYLAQYERLLRGAIKVHREGAPQPVFEGDAVFSPDQTGQKRIVYTQWGTGGAYSTGQITFEGDTLVFRNRQPDGNESDVRSVWRRTGPDGYRVTRERSIPEKGWLPLLEVDYRRLR